MHLDVAAVAVSNIAALGDNNKDVLVAQVEAIEIALFACTGAEKSPLYPLRIKQLCRLPALRVQHTLLHAGVPIEAEGFEAIAYRWSTSDAAAPLRQTLEFLRLGTK